MVPAILRIPVEIRDRIYTYLIQPQDVSITLDQAGQCVRSTNTHDQYCPSRVSYEVDALPSIVPTLGLLSSCHQIRAELQQLLIREDTNQRKSPIFKLDCILDQSLISPTWIALPTSLSSVHHLKIDIRVRYMGLDAASGKLMILFPRVFELLHLLFNHGPHFYRRQQRPQVSIDNISLNFHDKFTKSVTQQGTILKASVDARPISLQRIEQCLLGLNSYGLLRGRVKTIIIQFENYRKEIVITSGTVGQGTASSSEWLAWVYWWPKDDMSHLLDRY